MDELKTHIVSAVCLFVLLLLPLVLETNPIWLLAIIIIIALMVFRSALGEITRNEEFLFMFLNLLVLLISVIVIKFQIIKF
jgi:4-hydroxybenzoate polyprenyltransferase